MRALAWVIAVVAVILALAAWAGLFWLSWLASAPGHTTAANRATVMFGFAFVLSFCAAGAVGLAITVEENR